MLEAEPAHIARDQIPTYGFQTSNWRVLELVPAYTTLESLPTIFESVPACIALKLEPAYTVSDQILPVQLSNQNLLI